MNLIAFIFALVAVVCFVVAAIGTPSTKYNFVGWGLASLTIAWICQLVLATGSAVKLN